MKKIYKYPFILPTLLFGVLSLLGATAHPLWGDEAETALFARNILQYGVPKGWDGVNIMRLNNGIVLDSNLVNHLTSWAQYYLVAMSFAIFGEYSFSARLPFIILSVLSLPLLYKLVLKVTADKRLSFLTILITSLSVPVILFSFQARYYSLISLAALGLTYSALNFDQKKWSAKIWFILSGIAFFYGNYVLFGAFYLSLFLTMIIYLYATKRSVIRFIINWLVLSVIVAALSLPWYVVLKPYTGRQVLTAVDWDKFIANLWTYFYSGFENQNWNNTLPVSFLAIFLVLLGQSDFPKPFWRHTPLQ